MKRIIIPVLTAATEMVTKGLKTNLEAISGKPSTDSLQNTAVLGTSHIIRKLLQSETWSLSGGDHRCFVRSTRKKRPVTRDNNNNNNKIIIIIIIIIGRTVTRNKRDHSETGKEHVY